MNIITEQDITLTSEWCNKQREEEGGRIYKNTRIY